MARDFWSNRSMPQRLDTLSQFSCVLRRPSESSPVLETGWRRTPDSRLSLSNEPSLWRFDLGSLDGTNGDPAWFSALFTMKDPVQSGPLLVVGGVNLDQRSV